MTDWQDHLIVVPVVLPLIAAATMLLLKEQRYGLKALISLLSLIALVGVAYTLLHQAAVGGPAGDDTARIYNLGAWSAPFGITLVADRLSTLMLALTATLAAGGLMFSYARWDRAGPRFHALYLLLVMGVNGAVLTGDLFNLFVFFEVMLAASYGLALHGSGEVRVRAGVIYIAVNLTASLLFLIGVSLIYGVTGTLNMADLATKVPTIAADDLGLFHIGAAVLGTAFLIKCAMWPLGFWLTATYSAASAPAAAVFAILSKVGVYVIIRLSMLLFGADAGASAGFGLTWLMFGGLATIAFGTFGLIASRDLSRAAGFGVMISSGTVLAILGVGDAAALSGALFYLIGSTLACAALFLLAEILQRGREADVGEARAVFDDEYRDPFDDEERNEPGLVIPAAVAALGGAFLICTLMVAGMPPLAGFVGKLSMISALVGVGGAAAWTLVAVLSVSSLGALIGLTRLGVGAIWTRDEDAPAFVVGAAELTAVAALLGACVFLAIFAGSALIYTDHTAAWLAEPQGYIHAVLGGGGR